MHSVYATDKARDKGKENPPARASAGTPINNLHASFNAPALKTDKSSKDKGKEKDEGKENPWASNATQDFIDSCRRSIAEAVQADKEKAEREYEASKRVAPIPAERLGRGGTWTPVNGAVFLDWTRVVGREQAANAFGIPSSGTAPGYGNNAPFWTQTSRANPPLTDDQWLEQKTRMKALMAPSPAVASVTSSEVRPLSSQSTTSPTECEPLVNNSVAASTQSRLASSPPPEDTGYGAAAAQHLAIFAPNPSTPRPVLVEQVNATPEWFVFVPTSPSPGPGPSSSMLPTRYKPKLPGAVPASTPAFPPANGSAVSSIELGNAPDLTYLSSGDSLYPPFLCDTPQNQSAEDLVKVQSDANHHTRDDETQVESQSDPLHAKDDDLFRASLANLMGRQASTSTPLVHPVAQRATGSYLLPKRTVILTQPEGTKGLGLDGASPDNRQDDQTPQPVRYAEDSATAQPEQKDNASFLMARPARVRLRPRAQVSDRPGRPSLGPAAGRSVPLVTFNEEDSFHPSRHQPSVLQHANTWNAGAPSLPPNFAIAPHISSGSLNRIQEEPDEEEEEDAGYAADLDADTPRNNHSFRSSYFSSPSSSPATSTRYSADSPTAFRRPHRLAPRGSDDSLAERFTGTQSPYQQSTSSPLAERSPSGSGSSRFHLISPPPSPSALLSRFSIPLALIAEDEDEEDAEELAPRTEEPGVRSATLSSLALGFAVPMADISEEEEEEEDDSEESR